MTRFITYQCSLCPKALKPDDGSKSTGFALKWNGTGDGTLGDCRWEEAPIHICKTCLLALESFAYSAREANRL